MRFYDVDGIEMDVQDLKFYIDVEKYTETKEAIDDLLKDLSPSVPSNSEWQLLCNLL